MQNVPLFKEKDETRLSVGYGWGDLSSGGSKCFEIQSAHSFSRSLALMAGFSSIMGGDLLGNNYGKGHYFEFAPGLYWPTGNRGVVELYGGLGLGSQHHEFTNVFSNKYYGSSDLKMIKLFLQPSFGLTFDNFDVALSSRISRLSFTDVDICKIVLGDTESIYDRIMNLQETSHFFIEPALTIRGGWKNIKAQYQIQWSKYLSSQSSFGEEQHRGLELILIIEPNKKVVEN